MARPFDLADIRKSLDAARSYVRAADQHGDRFAVMQFRFRVKALEDALATAVKHGGPTNETGAEPR